MAFVPQPHREGRVVALDKVGGGGQTVWCPDGLSVCDCLGEAAWKSNRHFGGLDTLTGRSSPRLVILIG